MATTSYAVGDAEAAKLWSAKLSREAIKKTWAYKFMSSDGNNVINVKEETNKSKGDRITCILRMAPTGDGVSGDSTLEGNEEALATYTDNVTIDQLRHAVRSAGKMSEQRVPFSIREEARMGLQDWWADRFDTAFFNQICGYTAQSDTRYTGMQAATAPTAARIIRPGSTATDEDLSDSSTQKMSLTLVEYARELAETASPRIRPINLNGEDWFVMFLHDYQVTDLRTSTDTGQWLDIQKALTQFKGEESGLFTGALGAYNGVILHRANRVTQGVNSTTSAAVSTARRAVLCGAQAAHLAFGMDSGANRIDWVEEAFDYRNSLGVSAGSIFGLKKTVFNSQDFGTVVVSTYAAAHT